jgi:signal transduction histidine kinase
LKHILLVVCCLLFSFLRGQNHQKVDSSEQIVQLATANETIIIKAYYAIGTTLLKNKELENAYENLNSGLQKAIEINNEPLTALGAYHVGDYFLQTKDITQALTFFNTALVSFQNLDKKADVAKCYYKIGKSYNRISDFEKGLFYSFESLRLNETLKEEKEIIKSSTQIGAIYLVTGDYKNAELNFKNALQLQEKNNDDKGLILTYLNLGALSQKRENYEEALTYFKSGLLLVEKFAPNDEDRLNNIDNKAILLGNIGSTLRAKGEFEESLDYLFKALELKKEVNKNRSTAHTCNDIAETFMKMNQFAQAKEYALEAVRYAKNESVNQESWGYYLISKCDYALQNYKSSYDNFQKHNRLSDSIFTTQKAARINELQIQYKTEKRNFQIETQKKDIALLDNQNKMKSYGLLFGGAALLSIFGFILVFRSRNEAKKEQKLQESFSQNLILAQENERTRVSKDLHDSVGQQLTFIKKKAQNLDQPELSALAYTALEEVRSISRDLYPATLNLLGLNASIEQLLFDLDGETDMFFSVEIEDINADFNESETLNFYRFIQEAVNNVLKHSLAKTLIVTIVRHKKVIEVLIKDNGQGFQTDKATIQNSLGLKTMAERIRILKGSLSIESEKEEGTTLFVKIPV